MKYFSKNKKWMAYLILLTFLFTSIMPSNLGSMNSIAEAAAFRPTPVDVVDTDAAGISMELKNSTNKQFDSPGRWNNGYITQEMLSRTLGTDGYPKFANGDSLKSYFAGNKVKGLFIQREYANSGYYYYSSFENASVLQNDGTLQAYEEVMTPKIVGKNGAYATELDKVLYQRGNFLPYNSFKSDYGTDDTDRVRYDDLGHKLASPGETLYTPEGGIDAVDYYFGLSISAPFAQPKDGKVSNVPMVFEFNGDDDLWVFIDNVLVLDLGGIHIAQQGYINFNTGAVTISNIDANGNAKHPDPTTIKALFEAAGESTADFDGNTFADFTKHEIKIFYMERGDGGSDLKMKFNLPTFSGNPELQKLVEVNDEFVNNAKNYQFKVEVADDMDGDGKIDANDSVAAYTDKASIVRQDGRVDNINKVNAKDGITLKHGELAALNVDVGDFVRVTEVNGTEGYTKHQVDQTAPAKGTLEEKQLGLASDWHEIKMGAEGEERLFYQFFNTVETADLSITKELEGITDTETEFQFKVYFKNYDAATKKGVGGDDLVKQMPNWTLYKGELDSSSDGTIDTNDTNGIISLKAGETAVLKDIPEGTEYFITELLDDSEYVVKETQETVKINGTDVQGVKGTIGESDENVTITNTKYGSIEFTKTDGTDQPLEGVIFALYQLDSSATADTAGAIEVVSGQYAVPVINEATGNGTVATSDASGKVAFSNLAPGTYYVQETSAPTQYEISDTIYTAVVKANQTVALGADGTTTKVVNEVKKTTITGTKTWKDAADTRDRVQPTLIVYQGSVAAANVVEASEYQVSWEADLSGYTISGLDKYDSNGAEITYIVREAAMAGYTASYDGNNITNTLTADKTITGTKTWKDAADTSNRVQPTLIVYQGSVAAANVVEASEYQVSWEADLSGYTISGLDKYDSNGAEITYIVREAAMAGYTASYDGNNIINTLTGDADITVTKTWVDDNNRDGLRKAITVVLQQKVGSGDWADVASLPNYNNAAQPVTKEIALSDNMSHTWYNVPLYTNEGAEILYRVVENDVTGYVPSYSADSIGAKAANRTIEITNTHVPETVTIKVEKAWAGEAGYTALRGESLNFDVIGKVGTETVVDRDVTVSASDSWAAKTLTVPKYHNGNVITYTVTETAVPEGYEVSYKVNGSAGNTWSPQTQATLIERIVAFFTGEDTSAEDTTPAIDCTVTATNTLQTAGIKLTKAYSGGIFNGKTDVAGGATFTLTGNNSETITLTRDGAVYATTSAALKYGVVYTLQEGAPAGYTGAADQYLKLVKVEGAYKVVACDENGVVLTGNNAAAYSLSNNDIADLGTITNYVVKGSFVFTKAFNSAATDPTFIVYEAVKNGDAYTRGNKVTDIVSNEGMVYTISNLECGKSYEIVETAPGYEPVTFYLDVAEGTGDKANTAVVTLTKTLVAQVAKDSVWTINDGAYTLTNQAQKTNLVLTKTYDEKQENKIGSGTAIFEVYTDAKYENKIASVTFNADSNNYIFTDLEYGKTYYVKEIAPAGFVPVAFTIDVDVTANGAVVAAIEGYNANRDGSYTVNNEIKTTSLTFDKVYVGPQPDTKATFNVTNNKDDVKDTLKANAEGNYTMANLKYGYTYSVVENAPEGYVPVAFTVAVGTDGKLTVSQTKANGYETIDAIETADGVVTVKNYLKQDKVDLFGTKSWIGGTTDSAIEIKLFRDGAEQATTTTSVDFNWKYIFAGLDRFNLETGKAYEYTVVETPLDGFTAHYDETVTADGIQIDITNVKDEEMVAISGQKVWHDVAGTKHEPIEIALYRSTGTEDGKELVEKVTLSDEKGWTYNFGLLPKADPDSHIYYKYEVVELNVPAGYVSVVNGYDVHNIATPLYELGDISVTKKVVGTPANPNAVYDFVLYVKATVKGTLDSAQQKLQAVLVDDYLRLRDKELPAAEGAKEAAKAAFESSVFLTATSASAYTFFLTDESDNAVMGLTTGSAYYVDHVNMPLKKTEAAPAKLIGALITAIEELAEEFLNAIAEDPAAAKPTQSVMLSRIAQNSSVMKEAAAVNAVTTSAIAFKADNMQGLFDSVVTHKTTLQEYQDAKAAWEAFDTSVTTPTAIVLVVNGDFDNPIELDPEKGRQSEENENILEFTVENGEYTETVRFNTATGQYEIPFSLLKDETIKFNMKAATGSAIEYYITEDKPVDDNYDHTDIKAYLYNGSLKDLENTMKAEEYLNTLTSTTSKLTSGSAANYEFYNHYKEKESGGGGYTPPYIPPEDPVDPPKPPEEIIEDPEVPLDEPPVVVPGEEIPEPEVPLGDAPRTGDTNNAVPFMALMLFAMAGLAVTRRRFN